MTHTLTYMLVLLAMLGALPQSYSAEMPPQAKQSKKSPKIVYHFPDSEDVPEHAFLPSELEQLIALDTSLVMIDVRSPTEFSEGHLAGSRNIPSTEVPTRISEFRTMQKAQRNMVLISRDGKDAYTILKRLHREKIDRVWYLHGGIEAWIKAGRTLNTE